MTGRGRRALLSLLAPLLALAAAGPARATALPDLDDLVARADEIVVGTVSDVAARRLPEGPIVTEVTLARARWLKGPAGGAEARLLMLGGSVGGETLRVSGLPRFHLGITYLVFVRDNGRAVFPVVGGPRGLFQVRAGEAGEALLFDASGRGPVARFDVVVRAIADRLGP